MTKPHDVDPAIESREKTLFVAGMVRGIELRQKNGPVALAGLEAVALHSLLEAMALCAALPVDALERVDEVVRDIAAAEATSGPEAVFLTGYSHLLWREMDERKRRKVRAP